MAPTAYTPTASQWASAATHLDNRAAWRTVRIDGVRYVVLASGNSGRTYFVRADAAGCGCLWYERTGRQCSHMLAVECAAMEDELAAEAIVPLKAYRDMFPGCIGGCGQLTDHASKFCDECCAAQTRRLETAGKAALAGSRYSMIWGEE